jgi:hypothetical protein
MRPTRLPVPVLMLICLSACGEGAGASAGPVTRDSAGIRIVENAAPVWKKGQEWRLSAEPTLEIGMAEGAPEYLLSRVSSALRRADGGIVVANGGSNEIRFYDASGRHLRSVGREGEGPGEFRSLGWIQRMPGDSLLAYDFQNRRLSVFDPAGEFVRSFQTEPLAENQFPQVSGLLPDGSLLVQAGRVYGPGGVKDGLSRPPATFLHFSATGAVLDSIAVLPGSEAFVKTQDRGFTVMSPLFGRSPVHVVSGDRVILGGNDAYELAVYTPQGELKRLIRKRQAPRPVTDAAFEALKQKRLEGMDAEWRPRLEPMIEAMPRPATMPFYSNALADDEGNLWVQEFQAPDDSVPTWTVFDPEGRMLGPVVLPDRFRPTHIGRDFVLGVRFDELDVERVELFTLQRPA